MATIRITRWAGGMERCNSLASEEAASLRNGSPFRTIWLGPTFNLPCRNVDLPRGNAHLPRGRLSLLEARTVGSERRAAARWVRIHGIDRWLGGVQGFNPGWRPKTPPNLQAQG
jgi:hypothetical protein